MVVNFPKGVQLFFESLVSLNRIQSFLALPVIEPRKIYTKEPDHILNIDRASFSWGKSYADSNAKKIRILTDITLKCMKRNLVAVCGRVASGKTSLLQAILGEMELDNGEMTCATNQIAYVSQSSWILSGTIKDNILFGKEYDAEWFEKVIDCCALKKDLDGFSQKENTIIGERGVTLSGGQRSRLSVARAVYANADLYLLDDPLSALDTKTSRHLFEECFKKVLKDKTIILVTHQIQYLPECDATILMENGQATYITNVNEILSSDSSLSQAFQKMDSGPHPDDVIRQDTFVEKNELVQVGNTAEIVAEKTETGQVNPSVYLNYFRSGNSVFEIVWFLILMIIGQCCLVATDLWMARWSVASPMTQQELIFPMIQICLALTTVCFMTWRVVMFYMMCVSSSKHLFINMLNAVSRSPMSFFQSNPHGRITNRFSKDTSTVDEMLPQTFFDFFICLFYFAATLILTAVILPYSLLTFPFLAITFFYMRRYYLATSRQIKRIEAVRRSPVYSSIPSTLDGLTLIRAFGMDTRFVEQFCYLQNEHTRVMITFYSCVRWLGLRLDLMVTLFLAILAFGCVSFQTSLNLNPGMVGLLLSYLMALCDLLQWCVRQSAEAENMMVSTERILEYSRLEPEAPLETDKKVPVGWPREGRIQIVNLNLAYPAFSDQKEKLVLKSMTIELEPGRKVGIVGRTGAGKSSFLQALFRIFEPYPSGCISIDGINTSEIGLRDLRSNLSIIPQEPFCFKGSIRSNLDPFKKFNDNELWYALEMVGMKNTIDTNSDKLDANVSENGSNWSVGERQLICLARAILRNSRVVVMDEATSSIDTKTDKIIQDFIRTKSGLFANSTVITIAHRLNTIIDYDYILVLDDGRVMEYDTPYTLLQKKAEDPSAYFLRLVNEMGKEGDSLKQIALKK
jgi:ATP-binding cassette, subfamily C (CFTR/MRP), member 4